MRREGKSDRIIGLALVVVAAGMAAIVLLVGTARVRIVDASPAEGSEDVPITAPIQLVFSHPMDQTSVEGRFRIEPEVRGQLLWEGAEATWKPQSALSPNTTYTVSLEAGATSRRGRLLKENYVWEFRTRDALILFLGKRPADGTAADGTAADGTAADGIAADGTAADGITADGIAADGTTPDTNVRHLFAAAVDGSAPQQLTKDDQRVWDYAVDPQGETIVYSVLRDDGGSDLWRMDRDGANQEQLLACPGAACLNPVWSPDGQRLAYERRDIWADAPNLDPKAGRIWLFDVQEEEAQPLFDYEVPLHSPAWAPEGLRLAYVSPMLPGVEVYDLNTEELAQFGNYWGSVPVWSPDGQYLVTPDLLVVEEALLVRLVRISPQDSDAVDISGEDDLVKDTAPAWSPGGGWIAFGRQFLDEERWTPGRQIWLTRPDASEAYPLLSEPMADLFAFAWRPDGAALAYLRTDLSEGPQAVPDVSLWVFDLVQQHARSIADNALLPKWLP